MSFNEGGSVSHIYFMAYSMKSGIFNYYLTYVITYLDKTGHQDDHPPAAPLQVAPTSHRLVLLLDTLVTVHRSWFNLLQAGEIAQCSRQNYFVVLTQYHCNLKGCQSAHCLISLLQTAGSAERSCGFMLFKPHFKQNLSLRILFAGYFRRPRSHSRQQLLQKALKE